MNSRKLITALLLHLFLFIFATSAFAQRTVNGRVTDPRGNGIAGVTVSVKNSTVATATNETGNFSLSVPANTNTLVFSSVGFGTQEHALGTGDMNITLTQIAGNLSEVIVVGYGTTRRRDLTGSVATVNAKDFQKGNISTPEQLIAGKVPGVSIISNGGRPGSGSTIRIRGGASLNASNDPLIVIDGIPLERGGLTGAPSSLSFINPNDIESFTVLKDASAAAIYGTRASNGVILITTKKGLAGKLKVAFNSVQSVSKVIETVPVLSADQVRAIVNERGSAELKARLGTANTNWQDEIFQTGFGTDNNISLSGGVSKVPVRLSLGYQYLNGILRTDHMQKTSAALVVSPSLLNNHLRIDLNIKASAQKNRYANTGAIGSAIHFDPTQPVRVKDNLYGGYFEFRETTDSLTPNSTKNPVGLLEQNFSEQEPKRSIGNIQFDYKFHFLPELRANLNLGYDVYKNEGRVFVPASAASNFISGGKGGRNTPEKRTRTNTLADFYLNYLKDFTSIKSRVDLTAGYSFNNFQTKIFEFRERNAKGDTVAGTSAPVFPFNIPENTLISYFGRLNYSLNDRYLLTATLRRDGSSRFSEENRWGTFPSLALAWNIKRETFLSNNNTFSDLKLRIGYGVTGQQDGIGNYDYLSRYEFGRFWATYPFGETYYYTYTPSGFNSNLKWEETTAYNIGLDYGFLKGRINGSIDFYIKKTKDLLNSVPQPTGTNFGLYVLTNIGSMENRGVEFNINAQPVRTTDFTWDANFNITYNKNEITNLTIIPDDPNYIGFEEGRAEGVNGFVYLSNVGDPLRTFNMYKQIYDQNGKPIEGLFEDFNRDGIINEKDQYKTKSANPNVFMGFSSQFNWKKLSLGFVLRSNLNNYVYNNLFASKGRYNQVLGAKTTGNASVNLLETGFSGTNDRQLLSDYYLENASFLRMDNLTIGYDLGKVYRDRVALRLNAVVQNVFVITKYSGLDPEHSFGIDNNIYPRPRIYSLGINLEF